MFLRRTILVVAVATLAMLVQPPRKAEASELRSKIGSLARKITDLVKNEGHTEVAIGEITGPTDPASSSGPGIQQVLVSELARHEIKINQKAALIIKGEYINAEEEGRKDELILRLVLTVRNKQGKQVGEYQEDLTFKSGGNDEIARLLGLQVDLSEKTKATPQDRNVEMKKQLEKPPLHLDDCKIKTTRDGKYAVEVLVKAQGKGEFKPAVPRNKDGKPFVELNRGDVYKLRLHNADKIEAAASVTIDGVDAFQFFEPEKGRPTSFLVAPTNSRDVEGWPRGTESINEFLVGSYSDSAAAKVLKGSSKLGTITVCFQPCWVGKTPPPEYDGARSVEPNGTGFGKEIKKKSNVVGRTFGPLVASITIRYNK